MIPMRRVATVRYGYAKPLRAGLANKLFPWARCHIWCEKNNAEMLPYRWSQLALGPIWRREKDLRLYRGLFRRVSFCRSVHATYLRCTGTIDNECSETAIGTRARVQIFRFSGPADYFRSINRAHELIGRCIREEAEPKWISTVDALASPRIGIHVRLGDFGNLRHPVGWFVDALRFVRTLAGWTVPAVVFSDGADSELSPLLSMESTTRAIGPNALVDLLHLSRSAFLIATGSSTFSSWAAYLGQMPAMTRLNNPFAWYGLENQKGEYIGEWAVDSPAPQLVRNIQKALGSRLEK